MFSKLLAAGWIMRHEKVENEEGELLQKNSLLWLL